ncbi:MAG: hypothetical protein AMXMBFR12_09080 [Candidatus Babeliales bacterium]
MLKLPFILFITGVSGAGKTTVLKQLCSKLAQQSVGCFHFDSIGVPSVEQMIQEYGGPSQWQQAMTEKWVNDLLSNHQDEKLLILEGQVNLDFIKNACAKHNFKNYEIILIHCDDAIRHKRLRINRNQPELVNQDMDNWAHFLHRQAQQRNVTILDSGRLAVAQIVNKIVSMVQNHG